MRSNQVYSFSNIPQANIRRSVFDRSHGHKTMLYENKLVPVFRDEVLPGDTFILDTAVFGRMVNPATTVFCDNLYADLHFFFVPFRLLWSNFEKFMGQVDDPTDGVYDPTDYTIPQVVSPSGGFAIEGLSDYLGLPTVCTAMAGNTVSVSCLYHRAYRKIYNDFYRDENLIDAVSLGSSGIGDGPDNIGDIDTLFNRGKFKDYFTSCLPFVQKGPEVTIDLGTSAPITGIGAINQVWATGPANVYSTDKSAAVAFAKYKDVGTEVSDDRFRIEEDPSNTGFPNLRADLSSAIAGTINDLRQSLAIQALYETDARSGSRFNEIILAHFGVSNGDSRLQRAEYLGGGRINIQVTPVPQTSESGTTKQGKLTSYATIAGKNIGFSKSFVEWGVVLGIVSVVADLTYSQGIHRDFSKLTRFDFYWPALSNLGEQPVLSKELYAIGDSHDNDIFGYQERWSEYRYKPSQISGKLRPSYANSLDVWHLSQEFGSRPTLSQTFIEYDTPMDRILAVTTEPSFIMDFFYDFKCVRPMPTYSIPSISSRL